MISRAAAAVAGSEKWEIEILPVNWAANLNSMEKDGWLNGKKWAAGKQERTTFCIVLVGQTGQ